jgi:hypothetical protein
MWNDCLRDISSEFWTTKSQVVPNLGCRCGVEWPQIWCCLILLKWQH